MARLPHLQLGGIYTHFATADSNDKTYAQRQFDCFLYILDHLKSLRVEPEIRHAANSAATISLPSTHLDMVRTGIAIYGLTPSPGINKKYDIGLSPVLSLKSRVVQLKEVSVGSSIGYGATWKAGQKSIIATVPIGYADGLRRDYSSKGHMIINGQLVPIAGRICMDMTMLDVTHLPGIKNGDEVIIIGQQGNQMLSADVYAKKCDTINYEIVSTIGKRVQRIYSS